MSTIRTTAASILRTIAPIAKRQLARLIRGVHNGVLAGSNLARNTDVTRRDVHDRIVGEEVPRPQQQRHGLDGHDGKVLGRRDVRHAEGVPQHNVRVLDGLAAVADPLRQTRGWIAGCLGHVAAGGPELIVGV